MLVLIKGESDAKVSGWNPIGGYLTAKTALTLDDCVEMADKGRISDGY